MNKYYKEYLNAFIESSDAYDEFAFCEILDAFSDFDLDGIDFDSFARDWSGSLDLYIAQRLFDTGNCSVDYVDLDSKEIDIDWFGDSEELKKFNSELEEKGWKINNYAGLLNEVIEDEKNTKEEVKRGKIQLYINSLPDSELDNFAKKNGIELN